MFSTADEGETDGEEAADTRVQKAEGQVPGPSASLCTDLRRSSAENLAEIAKTLRGPPGRPGRGKRGPAGEPGEQGPPGSDSSVPWLIHSSLSVAGFAEDEILFSLPLFSLLSPLALPRPNVSGSFLSNG